MNVCGPTRVHRERPAKESAAARRTNAPHTHTRNPMSLLRISLFVLLCAPGALAAQEPAPRGNPHGDSVFDPPPLRPAVVIAIAASSHRP